MSAIIRNAAPSDCATLVRLAQAHARFEKSNAECDSKAIADALNSNPAQLHAWLAFSRKEAVGYASATVDFSTWRAAPYIHLDCLFVKHAYRGQGIGNLLFGAVQAFARERGVPAIEWQTPSWNTNALGFYERLGALGRDKVRFHLDLG